MTPCPEYIRPRGHPSLLLFLYLGKSQQNFNVKSFGCGTALCETSAALQWTNIYHWNILPICPLPLADVSLVLTLKAKVAPKGVVRGQTQTVQQLLQLSATTVDANR